MDYMCWLGSLGNSSTTSGSSDPGETRSDLLLDRRDFFFSCPLYFPYSLLTCYHLLCDFVLFHSCCSPIPIAILRLHGTCPFARRNSPFCGRSFAYQKRNYNNYPININNVGDPYVNQTCHEHEVPLCVFVTFL